MTDTEDLTREQILEQFLKVGDTITHTRCAGTIQEHFFSHREGPWLCGDPTDDTMRLEDMDGEAGDWWVNDISPNNVTHINRVPLDAVPFLAKPDKPKGEG